jgi:hypothetical protein
MPYVSGTETRSRGNLIFVVHQGKLEIIHTLNIFITIVIAFKTVLYIIQLN